MNIQSIVLRKVIYGFIIIMLVLMSSCDNKKDNKKEESSNASKVSLIDSIMKPIDSFILQKMDENKVIGLGAAIIVDKEFVDFMM